MTIRFFCTILFVLLCFCITWLISADKAIDSLRRQLKAEVYSRELLTKEKFELEKSLIRTRTQLNSLVNAYSERDYRVDSVTEEVERNLVRTIATDSTEF